MGSGPRRVAFLSSGLQRRRLCLQWTSKHGTQPPLGNLTVVARRFPHLSGLCRTPWEGACRVTWRFGCHRGNCWLELLQSGTTCQGHVGIFLKENAKEFFFFFFFLETLRERCLTVVVRGANRFQRLVVEALGRVTMIRTARPKVSPVIGSTAV